MVDVTGVEIPSLGLAVAAVLAGGFGLQRYCWRTRIWILHRPMTIRFATLADASLLPDIERSSGEAFRDVRDLAWIADDDVTPAERHAALVGQGTVWVASDPDGRLVGFLSAELHRDALHIWQMSVLSDQQRKGVGRALIGAAESWAESNQLTALTLTTFRSVAWNAPFYQSCGFKFVDPELHPMLLATLEAERQAGLPFEQRCAMLKPLR